MMNKNNTKVFPFYGIARRDQIYAATIDLR